MYLASVSKFDSIQTRVYNAYISGPNCWYGKRQIKVGAIYRPSPNIECAFPSAWDPLASCKKLPSSEKFLKKKMKRQGWYMNPMLKGYIETYLESIGTK